MVIGECGRYWPRKRVFLGTERIRGIQGAEPNRETCYGRHECLMAWTEFFISKTTCKQCVNTFCDPRLKTLFIPCKACSGLSPCLILVFGIFKFFPNLVLPRITCPFGHSKLKIEWNNSYTCNMLHLFYSFSLNCGYIFTPSNWCQSSFLHTSLHTIFQPGKNLITQCVHLNQSTHKLAYWPMTGRVKVPTAKATRLWQFLCLFCLRNPVSNNSLAFDLLSGLKCVCVWAVGTRWT